MKVGRNQPCPCGSGQKYKKCHGRLMETPEAPVPAFDLAHHVARHQAEQRVREQQQGLGRPIISGKLDDHQFVAVRNKLYASKTWKTFPDFLGDYIKEVLGSDWGNAEIAKPLNDRHVIMQWYDAYCRYQQAHIKTPGEVTQFDTTGVVACYLGLAYALYLIDHNVELQERLVRRLKDPGNFQGAYYELIVASALIRAGFELTLEDETDPRAKHCEFAAVSKQSGKKYWVEAKMRAVRGLLGRTERDGTANPKPTSHMIQHLNGALAKPAADDDRLIFIDLNTEMDVMVDEDHRPPFMKLATDRLERYEVDTLAEGVTAYVFITNLPFHRSLDGTANLAVAPFGLGMPDFNRPGYFRHSERYRQEQKHADALRIADAFSSYLKLPSTFDGSLPSEAFGRQSSRVQIGETYFFDDVGDKGTLGTVTSVAVIEAEKAAYVAITTPQQGSQILVQTMSAAELADYLAHPDAYFGRVVPVSKPAKTPYELFEFFMRAHKSWTREKLLQRIAGWPNFATLNAMSDDDLRAEYCEGLTASVGAFKPNAA